MLTLTYSFGHDIEPQMFVCWVISPYRPDSEFPQRRRCMPTGPGAVCVAPISISRSVDWTQLLVDVYASRVCTLRLDSSTVSSLMTHTVDLRVSIQEFSPAAARQEFSCTSRAAADAPEPSKRRARWTF